LQFLMSAALVALAAALTFIGAWVLHERTATALVRSRAAEREAALVARIAELERMQAAQQASLMPINAAMQAIWARKLTNAHTPEFDALLAKVVRPEALTEAEEVQFNGYLEAVVADTSGAHTPSERDAAHMLPGLIRAVRRDLGDDMSGFVQILVAVRPEDLEHK
jgi:hypothetical protein